jgi:hypothetical protein
MLKIFVHAERKHYRSLAMLHGGSMLMMVKPNSLAHHRDQPRSRDEGYSQPWRFLSLSDESTENLSARLYLLCQNQTCARCNIHCFPMRPSDPQQWW